VEHRQEAANLFALSDLTNDFFEERFVRSFEDEKKAQKPKTSEPEAYEEEFAGLFTHSSDEKVEAKHRLLALQRLRTGLLQEVNKSGSTALKDVDDLMQIRFRRVKTFVSDYLVSVCSIFYVGSRTCSAVCMYINVFVISSHMLYPVYVLNIPVRSNCLPVPT
jgi:hypothetical protein